MAVLSLAGDNDDYVTDRTLDLLTNNGITPRKLGHSTLTQARTYIRDNKLNADAYLYGAIRATYKPDAPTVLHVNRRTRETTVKQPVVIEISLRIVDINEDILWSKLLAERFDIISNRPATQSELDGNPMMDIIKRYGLFIIGGILILLFIIRGIMSNVKIR